MPKEKVQEDYEKQLTDSFERWDRCYTNGTQDPLWSDGISLNLIKNHINYFKHKIEDTIQSDYYPEIYYRDTPPVLPNDYMARADEIREAAKATLGCYLTDPDYQFLCRRVDRLTPKQAKQISIVNVIGYARRLEKAIQDDDLVTMRRHQNPDNYIDAFSSCAEHVRSIEPPENEQLSFFDMMYEDIPTCDENNEEEIEC
jgi:hypothetical protein